MLSKRNFASCEIDSCYLIFVSPFIDDVRPFEFSGALITCKYLAIQYGSSQMSPALYSALPFTSPPSRSNRFELCLLTVNSSGGNTSLIVCLRKFCGMNSISFLSLFFTFQVTKSIGYFCRYQTASFKSKFVTPVMAVKISHAPSFWVVQFASDQE